MNIESIAIIIVVAVIAAALGHFISRASSGRQLAALESELNQQLRENEAQVNQLESARMELEQATGQLNRQATELAVQKSDLATIRERRQELTAQLTEVGGRLAESDVALNEARQALSEAAAHLTAEQKRTTELQQRIEQLNQELAQQRDRTAAVEAERNAVREEQATLKTSLREKEEHFQKQLEALDEQKAILKKEFQNMANEILEAKGKAFSEQSKSSLDAMLNPFRQQITDFKQKVEHLQESGTRQQAEMRTELKQLQSMHQSMSQEAHNLATALKGQKKMQGNWGELVLENVLDRSGLRLGQDYKREDSFEHEEGGRGRPDVVIYLPQGKHLIIDAKVSLNDYTSYVNAENELERSQALKAHVKAFADRIKELADRDYYRLKGINSPEMVFMFVPIESAFVEALKADETLFQKAIEQNVLVATPTTLLTSLNIVRQLWRYEDQNKHTAELVKKAESVFKKLRTFLVSFEGIKKSLEKAQDSYAKAEGQLVSGPGNLVKQVSEFKQLAPAIKDQLPEYFTDKAELELEFKPTKDESPDDHALLIETATEEKEIA